MEGNCKRWSAFKKSSFIVQICASGVHGDLHEYNEDSGFLNLRPWKHELSTTDEKRSSSFTLTVDAKFGDENSTKTNSDGRLNGMLVGEVFWVGGVTNSAPEGVLLDRFNIEASKVGICSTKHSIFPMKNGHVILDSMMSLTTKNDQRRRELKAVFHAPNESGSYWKPIYTCTFPVEVLFSSDAHSERLTNEYYLDTTNTNQKLANIQSAMMDNAVSIRIGSTTASESRLISHSVASESVTRERTLFMMGMKGVKNVSTSPDRAFVLSRRKMQAAIDSACV